MTAGPALSIVICTYDRYDLIGEAVRTLLADPSLDPKRHEILVVDNTPPARRQNIGIEAPGLLRVEGCDTLGLSHARNHGIVATEGRMSRQSAEEFLQQRSDAHKYQSDLFD